MATDAAGLSRQIRLHRVRRRIARPEGVGGYVHESRLDCCAVWSRGDTIWIRWSRDGHTKTWSRGGLRGS